MLKVTTSWDDGDILDKRLAELLTSCGIKGTFYVSQHYRPERLADEDIRVIAKTHEVGAHTLTHPDLRILAENDRMEEVRGSKEWLEKITGSEVQMFCYPKGLYDAPVITTVKKAGFLGARTTHLGSIAHPHDPFRLNTTIQVYPFPFRKHSKEFLQPYEQRAPALKALGVSIFSMYSWLTSAKATFDISLEKGGVFHLWGHSWEIEKYGMWSKLEKLLRYIGQRKNALYLTNSELLK